MNFIQGIWVSDTRLDDERKTHAELRVIFIKDSREVSKDVNYCFATVFVVVTAVTVMI